MIVSGDIFTCVTCSVVFNDTDIQREHYKSEWHRYNLKRKVAELSTITLQDFQERVQLQKTQQEESQCQVNEEMFCKLCSKHFATANSFANHKQSNKHKEMETAQQVATQQQQLDKVTAAAAVKSDRAAKKAVQQEEYLKKQEQLANELSNDVAMDNDATEEGAVRGSEDDKDWEDIGEEQLSAFDESTGIDLTTCLFCEHMSDSLVAKCEHMAREHSFFIPDDEYVTDLEGLIKFLGIKLGTYHVCLWCSTKCYRDLLSVQKHMADKGHQKMKFEGETLIEYADYYLYEGDTTIDDEYDIVNNSDVANDSRLSLYASNGESQASQSPDDENFELVLPSGTRIGHRSLFRYYKQSFGHRSLELKARSNVSIKDKYRAIASNSAFTQTEIKKQRKDMAYFQRWSAKWNAKLGWEANKLQKHFRRQDITF